MFKKQTIFPYYHIVRDDAVPHIENLYPYKNTAQFLADVKILLENYRPLEPSRLLSGKLPDNHFLLTFDDGLHEVYSVIYPILKDNGISAVFFVNPDFVDNQAGLYKHSISAIISRLKETGFEKSVLDRIGAIFSFTYTSVEDFKRKFIGIQFSEREKIAQVLSLMDMDMDKYLKQHTPYITKDQIRQMMADGFYFGGHTMSHPPLQQLTHDEQKSEIINSVEWLRSNFGIEYSFFAFPFSDKAISGKLLRELLEYDPDIVLFGNSGLKKDISSRIIQRFSLEHPAKATRKQIVMENLYKYFNKII
ncbi:polysaccharide deacetylase family protein [Flavobacterium selenitireducens]|uniref:polysaccharide deacetylase family protein n=1 Tax=Flavobacterium selenitireducens TaxID=2722704 RepID=UPI00168BDA5C|nr:polysaccharide deacetylase family protein [Flavobacterium selenitireducens]